jgi:HAD superfamily hydrolase (TIGR01484 family)
MRLICTDFDGTIYDPSEEPPVSVEFVNWVKKTQASGGKWVINTGRELHSRQEFASLLQILGLIQLDVQPDFIVSVERHIHVHERGEYLDHKEWNESCVVHHQTLFEKAGDLMHRMREWIQIHTKAHIYEDDWSPLCIIANHVDDANLIHARVQEECTALPDLTVMRNGNYFRFSHVGYNKGTALSEIARLLEIQRKDIFVAGDHFNDLTMLDGKHAGFTAAPSNAISEVKELVQSIGGYIAQRPCSSGVAEALNHFSELGI